MIFAAPESSFEAVAEGATTGLVGTIGVRIMDGIGGTTTARTTTGIVETPAGSGIYAATLTAPDARGSYVVAWDTGGGTPTWASEQLVVTYSAASVTTPSTDDPYFTVAEFRGRYPDLTEAEYPDETVDEYRAIAEAAIEDAVGVAYVPRERTRTVNFAQRGVLDLGPQLRTITAVSIDGTAYTEDELADLDLDTNGIIQRSGGWTGLTVVTYTHGYDAPTGEAKLAAMALTRQWMVHGPVSERATQIPTENGGTINLATPGMLGARFGVPFVDAFVEANRVPAVA